jgi:hypothetical protein
LNNSIAHWLVVSCFFFNSRSNPISIHDETEIHDRVYKEGEPGKSLRYQFWTALRSASELETYQEKLPETKELSYLHKPLSRVQLLQTFREPESQRTNFQNSLSQHHPSATKCKAQGTSTKQRALQFWAPSSR